MLKRSWMPAIFTYIYLYDKKNLLKKMFPMIHLVHDTLRTLIAKKILSVFITVKIIQILTVYSNICILKWWNEPEWISIHSLFIYPKMMCVCEKQQRCQLIKLYHKKLYFCNYLLVLASYFQFLNVAVSLVILFCSV